MKAEGTHGADGVITVEGLKKSYRQLKVLDGIALNIQRGTVFALLGQNGAGKTTTIRILATLLKPDAGRATIMGYDVVRQPEHVRRVISLTGQFAAVDELLTGEENAVLLGRLYHLGRAEARRRAAEVLGRFGLAEDARRIVKTYSGGMRRRLDLAVSLMAAPPILFLDEPTTGLDPRSRRVLWEMIRDLRASGVTVFLTTQYLEEADQLADVIAVMDGGKIIAEGTADQLKRRDGQERLELAFAHQHALETARRVLGGQLHQPAAQSSTLSVAIDGGPWQIKAVLDQMQQAAIEVDSIALRKPTLDDVFLTLTGRHAGTAPGAGGRHDD